MSTNQTKLSQRLQQFANWMQRLLAPDAAPGAGNDLLQLYLLSRGSDSVRPAVIRKLRANARG